MWSSPVVTAAAQRPRAGDRWDPGGAVTRHTVYPLGFFRSLRRVFERTVGRGLKPGNVPNNM